MKVSKIKYSVVLAAVMVFIFSACEDPLQEETFSTLGPSNFYSTADDAESLLNSAYAQSQGWRDLSRDYLTFNEFTTDIAIERQGAINALTQPIEDFNIQPSHPWFDFWWERYYSAIYRANTVLDQVPNIDMNPDRRDQILAEARFLRAFNYFYLYDIFGPTPLITTSETSVEDRPVRAAEEEFTGFVADELRAVSEILPASQGQYGRATSGAALAFLTRLHLRQMNWQEVASTAQEVIDLGEYSIYDPPASSNQTRNDLFAPDNQYNDEFIYVIHYADGGAVQNGDGNTYLSHAAPPGYAWEFVAIVNFAAQFKIRDQYLELFDDPEDERLNAFIFEYQNQAGETIILGEDDVRSFKYPEDPDGTSSVTSIDIPLIRYADILLMRAEALNELNGVNQESINLINDVRNAAGVYTISQGDFASVQELRDFILDERGREFHTEFLRRQDLIRHGKFIEMAQERGKPAQEHHTLFPIPQPEIDRNPELEQNPGY